MAEYLQQINLGVVFVTCIKGFSEDNTEVTGVFIIIVII